MLALLSVRTSTTDRQTLKTPHNPLIDVMHLKTTQIATTIRYCFVSFLFNYTLKPCTDTFLKLFCIHFNSTVDTEKMLKNLVRRDNNNKSWKPIHILSYRDRKICFFCWGSHFERVCHLSLVTIVFRSTVGHHSN